MAYRILLSGGGTGGHLVPAMNLAAAFRRAEPDSELMLVGAQRGIEAEVLPGSGWPYRLLPLEPVYRSRPWRNWKLVSRLPAVLGGLSRTFSELRPHIVVGTGGYASGPAVAWAVARGVPTAIQEQNAMPGLATRALAPWVDQIHLGQPEARRHMRPGRSTEVFDLGNPVEIRAPARPFEWPEGRVLLVFGGSQGALALNELLLEGLRAADDLPDGVSVVWVTGPAHHDSIRMRLAGWSGASRVRVVSFIAELGAQLGHAALAVCRAGAMTCSELAAAGLPSILVPLPTSAGDHQRYNAIAMQDAGACVMREEGTMTGSDLVRDAFELMADSTRLSAMAAASLRRGKPDASDRIVARLLTLAGRSREGPDE